MSNQDVTVSNGASPRETIRAELEGNQVAFLALLDSLADTDLPRKSANPPWTVRDILFHIVLSLEYVPREVKAARGRRNLLAMPQVIYDPLNVLITKLGALRQNRESLRQRYAVAHQIALELLDTIGEAEWSKSTRFFYVDATIEMLFRRQAQHIAEHIVQIQPVPDKQTGQHWREVWEDHAQAERQAQDHRSVGNLLEAVRQGKFGDYHSLWYAIAARATLAEAGWTLLTVLESDLDYLHRYHCAAALLQLIGDSHFEPVELSAARYPLAENLAQVRRILEERLGSSPSN